MGRRSKGAGRHLDQAQGKAAVWDAVPRSPSLPLRWPGSPLGGPAETQVWRVSGAPVQTGRSTSRGSARRRTGQDLLARVSFACTGKSLSVSRAVGPLISGYGSPHLRSLLDLSLISLLRSLSNQPLSRYFGFLKVSQICPPSALITFLGQSYP